MTKPIIALDYDGTIVTNSWPEHGKPLPDAARSIKKLLNDFDIIIHTCRIAPYGVHGEKRSPIDVAKEVKAIDRKLKSMGLPTMEIHQDPWKPGADIYLDDKAMRFHNWHDANRQIEHWKIAALFTKAMEAQLA
jgi:hypothetical protein